MDIAVCGKCGWIGHTIELKSQQKKPGDGNELIALLIQRNGLKARCCPVCDSTEMYYKDRSVVANVPYQFAEQQIPTDRVFQSPEIAAEPVRVSERPKAPQLPEAEVKLSLDEEVFGPSEDVLGVDDDDDDVELTADIVQQVLDQAAEAGAPRSEVARDMADGLGRENKELIARVADVPIETLKDKPKTPRKRRPKVREAPKPPPTWECDVCGAEFQARSKSSRCKKCMDAYMEQMVG